MAGLAGAAAVVQGAVAVSRVVAVVTVAGVETATEGHRSQRVTARGANRRFATGLARACGGAILFSLPLMMTMEMWQLGFTMNRSRLALLLVLMVPLLTALSQLSGFEETFSLSDNLVDAFVACAVGFVASAAVLVPLAVLEWGMSLDEVIGKVALQAVPGSIGAALAVSQLQSKGEGENEAREGSSYPSELFLMVVGALFLAFNVAPTEEMVNIAYRLPPWHTLALVLASLLVMHAFVYAVEFRGQEPVPQGASLWSVFLRFTVVGYALALLVSLYILWTFGRTVGLALAPLLTTTVVLGFPAALGAAHLVNEL